MKSEETIRKIMAEFEAHLRNHLFSEKSYPKTVKVTTVYDGAIQTVEIEFTEVEDGNINSGEP